MSYISNFLRRYSAVWKRYRYGWVALFFIIITFVIGDSNLYKHYVCTKKIRDMEENIKRHREELETTRKKTDDIRNDKESLERYAREEFLMKKENEDIYIIEDK